MKLKNLPNLLIFGANFFTLNHVGLQYVTFGMSVVNLPLRIRKKLGSLVPLTGGLWRKEVAGLAAVEVSASRPYWEGQRNYYPMCSLSPVQAAEGGRQNNLFIYLQEWKKQIINCIICSKVELRGEF